MEARRNTVKSTSVRHVTDKPVTPALDDVGNLLVQAADILKRRGFTRNAQARNAAGQEVGVLNAEARVFDLSGALLRAQAEMTGNFEHIEYDGLADAAHDALCKYLNTSRLTLWSDMAVSSDQVAKVLHVVAGQERTQNVSRLN